MMERLIDTLVSVGQQIIAAIPSVIYALIIILVGYLIAVIVRKAVSKLFDILEGRFIDRTAFGKRLREAGIDLGDVVAAFVFAFIIALTIMVAITVLNIPGVTFIAEIMRIVVNIIGGLLVIVLGVPLAVLASEYIAKLIVSALRDKHEVFIAVVSTVLAILLIVFVFGLAIAIMFGSTTLLQMLTIALPSGVMAGVIIVIGYIIGDLVGKLVKDVTERLAKPVEDTDVGKALKGIGIDMPILLGGLVKATIVVLSIAVGLGMIGATGIAGDILSTVAYYLPRVLGAVILLTLGLALVLILSRYIGKVFRAVLREKYEPLANLIENLIALGLIAAFVAIALNIVGLLGNLVYALIIGSVVIAIGIMITETVTRLLTGIHTTLDRLGPVIGALIAIIFAYVGVSAILSQISGLTEVLKTIGWGIAIAFAVMLIPLVFYFIRIAWREAEALR
jgi:hypothetical protein